MRRSVYRRRYISSFKILRIEELEDTFAIESETVKFSPYIIAVMKNLTVSYAICVANVKAAKYSRNANGTKKNCSHGKIEEKHQSFLSLYVTNGLNKIRCFVMTAEKKA